MKLYHATSAVICYLMWAVTVIGMVIKPGPWWIDLSLFLISLLMIFVGRKEMRLLKSACEAESQSQRWVAQRWGAEAGATSFTIPNGRS